MAFHDPNSASYKAEHDEVYEGSDSDDIPSAVLTALSGGPLAEAAEQNTLREHGCRDTDVPDETPGAHVTPPISESDPTQPEWTEKVIVLRLRHGDSSPEIKEGKLRYDPTSVPFRRDVLTERDEWEIPVVTGLFTEAARQIAEQRELAYADNLPRPTRFEVSIEGIPRGSIDDHVIKSLTARFAEKGWNAKCDLLDETSELMIVLT